jgi:DNA-binding beta-propeller fold protein YncE
VLATIPVGQSPKDIAVSSDGSELYVSDANGGVVSVISIDSDEVTT